MLAVAVLFAASLIVLTAATALAGLGKIGEFGSEGTGPGQFDATTNGVAVEQSTGNVYAIDQGTTDRVHKFDANGTYLSTFDHPSFTAPMAVAVDQATNDVYVTEVSSPNRGVYKFDSSGTFDFKWGSAGTGNGEFQGIASPDSLAVDSSGNVYVADFGQDRVQKFDSNGTFLSDIGSGDLSVPRGLAFDSAGNLYVADLNEGVRKYDPSGTFVSTVVSGSQRPAAIAIDPADNLYVYVTDGTDRVVQFDPSGTALVSLGAGTFASGLLHSLVYGDAAETLYVSDGPNTRVLLFGEIPPGPPVVGDESVSQVTGTSAMLGATVNPTSSEITSCEFEYGTTTSYANSVPCDPIPTGTGASPIPVSAEVTGLEDGATYHWRIVAANGEGSDVGADQTFTTLTLPTVSIDPPSDVSAHSATFTGTINPEGNRTKYQFEYSDDGFVTSDFLPGFRPNLGAGTEDVLVEREAFGLIANTDYEVRLIAYNNAAGDVVSSSVDFSTPAIPPSVEMGTPTAGKDVAVLRGLLNPENQQTSYFFEWGTDTSYGHRVPVPDGTATGGGTRVVAETVSGLEPDQVYHYRLTAENATGETDGPDQSVQTSSNNMINDRAYELVTPVSKGGAAPVAWGSVSEDGEAVLWNARSSFGEDADGAPVVNNFYASRSSDGWSTSNVSPFVGRDVSNTRVHYLQYITSDLGHGVYFDTDGPEGVDAPAGISSLFARALPNAGYLALAPEYPVATGNFGFAFHDGVRIVGHDADFSNAFVESLSSDVTLCGEGDGGAPCETNTATGEMRPVNVLPDRYQELWTQADGGTFTLSFDGEETIQIPNGVPGIGVQIALEALPNLEAGDLSVNGSGTANDPYRVIFGKAFVNVDTPALEADGSNLTLAGGGASISVDDSVLATGGQGARLGRRFRGNIANSKFFQKQDYAVSADGNRSIWTFGGTLYLRDTGTMPPRTLEVSVAEDGSVLTGSSLYAADPNLNTVYFSAGVSGLYRFDVAAGQSKLVVPAKLITRGFVNASDGGSHIYFAAQDELTPDAQPGTNMYLWRDDGTPDGELQLVAERLVGGGLSDSALWAAARTGPSDVSQDGRYLAFKSLRPPVGYDNVGPCEPISNSSNFPPGVGPCRMIYVFDAELPEGHPDKLRCVSCNPSGAPPVSNYEPVLERDPGMEQPDLGGSVLRPSEPRYISGDSVFFQSWEPLVAGDTNGQPDIYEYDIPSGQLALVTTGKGAPGRPVHSLLPADTVRPGFNFLGASADGDVFFATFASLVGRDVNGGADVYVARAGGGFPEPVPDTPCEGDECQGDPTDPPDEEAIGSTTADGSNVDAEAQRCERLANRFQALKDRFLRLRLAYHRTDDPALKRRIARRARRVKQRAIQVRQAARECRENL